MEDKKLIDNASATTIDNFYGNQGGKDVQIPLATAASVLAGAKAIPYSIAKNDTTSLSSYYIVIDGYCDAFDHTCKGGGICIVSSQHSKIQLLLTDWGVKYRIWSETLWGEWLNIS